MEYTLEKVSYGVMSASSFVVSCAIARDEMTSNNRKMVKLTNGALSLFFLSSSMLFGSFAYQRQKENDYDNILI